MNKTCLSCSHFKGNFSVGFVCDSFPEVIPISIISGVFVHDKKYANEQFIWEPRFKKIESTNKNIYYRVTAGG